MLNKNVLISILTLLSKTWVLYVYRGGRGQSYSVVFVSSYNVTLTNNQPREFRCFHWNSRNT